MCDPSADKQEVTRHRVAMLLLDHVLSVGWAYSTLIACIDHQYMLLSEVQLFEAKHIKHGPFHAGGWGVGETLDAT